MSTKTIKALSKTVRLTVQVVPNAKRSEVVGMHGDAVKVRLQAPPVDGKANDALVHFIAEVLGLPKSATQLVQGHTARRKILEITMQEDVAATSIMQTLLATTAK